MIERFGVEHEFFGIDTGTALNALRNAGLSADDDGYHHEAKPYWRVTEDSSVAGEGLELVSPILRDNQTGRDSLSKALDALRTEGARVDSTCGLHVHHSADDMSPAQVASTVAHYAAFQPVISDMMHESRQYTEYTSMMHEPREWYERITRFETYRELRDAAWGFNRYQSVNLSALRAHDTLEFREHAGTLIPARAMSWVKFTRQFMRIGKSLTLEHLFRAFDDPGSASVEDMCDYLMLDDDMMPFMRCRAGTLPSPPTWRSEDRQLDETVGPLYCDHCDERGHEAGECEWRAVNGGECSCWRCNEDMADYDEEG